MRSGASASRTPSATRCSAAADKHTPFGSPVVPDVKVIFDVPTGSGAAAAGMRNSASASPCSVKGCACSGAKRGASAAATTSASTPAARSACAICADVKNCGSGTCTRPASRHARSIATQAAPLSSSVATRRAPAS
jgi:hypothetical protein